MIYTIGDADAYERNFKNVPGFEKLGKTSSYAGGSVWRTQVEAQRAATSSGCRYAVYGVLADWGTDVETNSGPHGEGALLITSRIVHVEPKILVFKVVLGAALAQYSEGQQRAYVSALISAPQIRTRLQIGDICRLVAYHNSVR